ncbi:MAG: PEP-CTERM sorting domain-containing protein [Gemmatimonadota bacterium]|nr:PEP-CTERM sorting domain-containing protein [Gemmatimonadota bacterium]
MKAFNRGLILTAAIITPTFAIAGGSWEETFDHNNPALYTNMNGQPDNLTITGGVARFSGAGGAYYARQDLLIQLTVEDYSVIDATAPEPEPFTGTVGVGWFSPTLNQGISVLGDFEAETRYLVRHDGWNSSVVLAFDSKFPFGKLFLMHFGGGNWGTYGTGAQSIEPEEDMFFFMYGSELSGPGQLDTVFAAAATPEPSSIAALGVGAATLLLLRRRRQPSP